mmetsp:Transcript_22212/g.61634  ORF Transcript_22212/g.61634 Transcript_22212/m.61634 type:complete len:170 (+) Transcript_22212:1190-1699(+)
MVARDSATLGAHEKSCRQAGSNGRGVGAAVLWLLAPLPLLYEYTIQPSTTSPPIRGQMGLFFCGPLLWSAMMAPDASLLGVEQCAAESFALRGEERRMGETVRESRQAGLKTGGMSPLFCLSGGGESAGIGKPAYATCSAGLRPAPAVQLTVFSALCSVLGASRKVRGD